MITAFLRRFLYLLVLAVVSSTVFLGMQEEQPHFYLCSTARMGACRLLSQQPRARKANSTKNGTWPFTSGMLLCKEAILPSWKDIEELKVLGREARSLKGMETFVCCERSKHSKPLPLRGYDWKDVSWLRHKINSALKVVEVQLWTRERALRVLNGSLDFTQIRPRRRRLYPNGVGGEEAQPVAASRPDRTSLQIVEKSRCPLHAVMLQGTCTFNSCRIYWISSFILN